MDNKKRLIDSFTITNMDNNKTSTVKIYYLVREDNDMYYHKFILESELKKHHPYDLGFPTKKKLNNSFITELSKSIKNLHGAIEEKQNRISYDSISLIYSIIFAFNLKIFNSHKIDEYFEKYDDNHAFTDRDIVEFCALNNKLSWDEINGVVKDFIQNYHPAYEDEIYIFFPELFDLDYYTTKYYIKNSKLVKENATVEDCKRFYKLQTLYDDYSNIKMNKNKAYDVYTLFKDYDMEMEYKNPSIPMRDILSIIFENKELYNNIDNMTLKDVYKALNIKYYYKRDDLNKEIFERATSDDRKFSFQSFNKMYFDLVNKSDSENIEPEWYYNFYKKTEELLYSYSPILSALEQYISEKNSLSKNDVIFIVDTIVNTNIQVPIIPAIIVDYLLERTVGSKVIELAREVKVLDYPIMIESWLEYINHYEEYKDLPINWWIELIDSKN